MDGWPLHTERRVKERLLKFWRIRRTATAAAITINTHFQRVMLLYMKWLVNGKIHSRFQHTHIQKYCSRSHLLILWGSVLLCKSRELQKNNQAIYCAQTDVRESDRCAFHDCILLRCHIITFSSP